MENNNIEIILKNKIRELACFLISICDSEDNRKNIEDSLLDLPTYKIMFFLSFLNRDKIDNQIDDFIKIYSLIDTIDNREKIKDSINYFLEVKQIIYM